MNDTLKINSENLSCGYVLYECEIDVLGEHNHKIFKNAISVMIDALQAKGFNESAAYFIDEIQNNENKYYDCYFKTAKESYSYSCGELDIDGYCIGISYDPWRSKWNISIVFYRKKNSDTEKTFPISRILIKHNDSFYKLPVFAYENFVRNLEASRCIREDENADYLKMSEDVKKFSFIDDKRYYKNKKEIIEINSILSRSKCEITEILIDRILHCLSYPEQEFDEMIYEILRQIKKAN